MSEVRRAFITSELHSDLSVEEAKAMMEPSMAERYPGFIRGKVAQDMLTMRIYEYVIVDGDVWQRETGQVIDSD